jgi:hypothetical protein
MRLASIVIAFVGMFIVSPVPGLPSAPARGADQLAPGKKPGAFRFVYRGRVRFSRDAMFPVMVTLEAGQKVLAQKEVTDERPFTIEADVPPGRCGVHSEPATEAGRQKYWDAFGVVFNVNGSGVVTQRTGSDEIKHNLKMKLLGPDGLEVVKEKRPVLRWEPVPGAKYYVLGWFEETPRDRRVIKTVQPLRARDAKYRFEEDVVPGRVYEWFVHACDDEKNEEPFAYYSSGYFVTPGTDTKDLATPKERPAGTPRQSP